MKLISLIETDHLDLAGNATVYEVFPGEFVQVPNLGSPGAKWVPVSDLADGGPVPIDDEVRTLVVRCDGGYIGHFRDWEHLYRFITFYMRSKVLTRVDSEDLVLV